MTATALTKAEQVNVRLALAVLRRSFGTRRVASEMGVSFKSVKHYSETSRKISRATAQLVAKVAGASAEEILAGKWNGETALPIDQVVLDRLILLAFKVAHDPSDDEAAWEDMMDLLWVNGRLAAILTLAKSALDAKESTP